MTPPDAAPQAAEARERAASKPMKIRYESLDELRDHPDNPNQHTPDQIGLIERSLAEFGWTNIMAKAGGVLIYGHARKQAAINLRNKGIAIPGNDDPNKGPVADLSHLTKAQRRAYLLADNEIARKSKNDPELVRLHLAELSSLDFDLSLTGFDATKIAGFLDGPALPPPPVVRTTVKTVECPKCSHAFTP